MGKKLKKRCCKKYRRKGKACSSCPLMARLDKGERRRLIAAHKLKKAEKKGKK
ncbi:MAG: hypothetical protein AAGN66_18830 [Acidobacteriota bacterium]